MKHIIAVAALLGFTISTSGQQYYLSKVKEVATGRKEPLLALLQQLAPETMNQWLKGME